jgi:hypothetical protein
MMSRSLILTLSGLLIPAFACGGILGDRSMKRCYKFVDGKEVTILILDEGGHMPSVTVMNPDGSDAVMTVGRLEPGAFVYQDGTRLFFDEQTIRGSDGSLLEGLEGTATTCP